MLSLTVHFTVLLNNMYDWLLILSLPNTIVAMNKFTYHVLTPITLIHSYRYSIQTSTLPLKTDPQIIKNICENTNYDHHSLHNTFD